MAVWQGADGAWRPLVETRTHVWEKESEREREKEKKKTWRLYSSLFPRLFWQEHDTEYSEEDIHHITLDSLKTQKLREKQREINITFCFFKLTKCVYCSRFLIFIHRQIVNTIFFLQKENKIVVAFLDLGTRQDIAYTPPFWLKWIEAVGNGLRKRQNALEPHDISTLLHNIFLRHSDCYSIALELGM